MTTRDDVRFGRNQGKIKPFKQHARVDPIHKASVESNIPTIVIPNARKICSILLFFIGSFSIGFGAGFGTGYAFKECV